MSLDAQSQEPGESVSPKELVQRLRDLDEELPDELRVQLLVAGPSVVPDLLAVLEDEFEDELEDESVEPNWAPLHAAKLLGTLGDVQAVPLLLHCFEQCKRLDPLYEQLSRALVSLGEPTIEGCLKAYMAATDDDLRDRFAEVLSHCKTQDEPIYEVLLDTLERSPELGAMYLSVYGDPRALPALSRVFDTLPLGEDDAILSNHVFVELQAAIEKLGGQLTDSQAAKAESADAPRRRFAAQMNEAIHRLAAQQRLEQAPSTPPSNPSPVTGKRRKIGRNEPCWCGSGKKYKKCHLDLDHP